MSGKQARASKARKRESSTLYLTNQILEWGKMWVEAEQAKTALRWPMQTAAMSVIAIDRATRTITVSVI
jgi:hypothetical protein